MTAFVSSCCVARPMIMLPAPPAQQCRQPGRLLQQGMSCTEQATKHDTPVKASCSCCAQGAKRLTGTCSVHWPQHQAVLTNSHQWCDVNANDLRCCHKADSIHQPARSPAHQRARHRTSPSHSTNANKAVAGSACSLAACCRQTSAF